MESALNVPHGWFNPFFGWHLNLDWSNIIPDANKKIADDGLDCLVSFYDDVVQRGVCCVSWPGPNYDMQKILSSQFAKGSIKDDRFCIDHFIADPVFNGYWIDCVRPLIF